MFKHIALLVLLGSAARSGFERTDIGTRPRALGGAFVGLANDLWAVYHNPGGLASLTSNQIGLLFSPSGFGLSELSQKAAAATLTVGPGVAAVAVRQFGFELYQETSLSVALSTTLESVGLGVAVNHHTVKIKNHGSASTIGIDIGTQIKIIPAVIWGLALKGINAPSIGSSREELPRSISSGIAYSPAGYVTLLIDYAKETSFNPALKGGIEYFPVEAVAIRVGVVDQPTSYSGGIGVSYGPLAFDYAIVMHPLLGLTHEAAIILSWGRAGQ